MPTGESEPTLIAHHYGRAGEAEKSFHFWLLAADRSSQRLAFADSIANLTSALVEAERVADPDLRAHLKSMLSLSLVLRSSSIKARKAARPNPLWKRRRRSPSIVASSETPITAVSRLYRSPKIKNPGQLRRRVPELLLSRATKTCGNIGGWISAGQDRKAGVSGDGGRHSDLPNNQSLRRGTTSLPLYLGICEPEPLSMPLASASAGRSRHPSALAPHSASPGPHR
jgi:hypothetical protein